VSADSLSPLTRAEQMLANIDTPAEALDVIDLAEVARVYAQQARLGTGAVNAATVVKVRAECRLADVVDRGQAEGRIATAGGDQQSIVRGSDNALSLDELGVSRQRLAEARLLRDAGFTDERLTELQTNADHADRVLSRTSMLAEARRSRHVDERDRLRTRAVTLPPGQYACVELDPPWSYRELGMTGGKSSEFTYPTMEAGEIAALPVTDLAATNAHLYLWTTFNHLQAAWDIAEGWGFNVRNLLVWDKRRIGTGAYFRNSSEFILFGLRGTQPLLRNDQPTVFQWPTEGRVHSRKPDGFYDLIETCSPGPRVRLFARSQRPGWTSWGNEAGDDGEATA
jgi:N6-adenosine-specific RNA methylase IME4